MSIQVQCTRCHKTMKVKDSLSGTRGLCPFCKKEIEVSQVAVRVNAAEANLSDPSPKDFRKQQNDWISPDEVKEISRRNKEKRLAARSINSQDSAYQAHVVPGNESTMEKAAATDDICAESQLAALDDTIANLKVRIARIRAELLPYQTEATRASRKLAKLKFRRWLRAPSAKYGLWKFGLIFLVSTAAGTVCFVVMDVAGCALFYGLSASALVFIALAARLWTWSYFPSDSALPGLISVAETNSLRSHEEFESKRTASRLTELEQERSEMSRKYLQLMLQASEEKQEAALKKKHELASGKRIRAELLQRNWKAMRDDEWETFLVEVFRALGASAERIGCAGDQGCDLIVEIADARVAVQAKGYYHAVSNKAVQEAYAGMRHHNCCACAVITNSRFTKSAGELAQSTGCVLIGEDEFANFVTGSVNYFSCVRQVVSSG